MQARASSLVRQKILVHNHLQHPFVGTSDEVPQDVQRPVPEGTAPSRINAVSKKILDSVIDFVLQQNSDSVGGFYDICRFTQKIEIVSRFVEKLVNAVREEHEHRTLVPDRFEVDKPHKWIRRDIRRRPYAFHDVSPQCLGAEICGQEAE